MLANKVEHFNPIRRIQGFEKAIQSHHEKGITSHTLTDFATLSGGYEAAKRLLKAHPEITAIFTYNDLMGLGAIRACLEMGLHIPNDISSIGFDDIQLASMYTPALSTIRVDKYKMGKLAFERTFQRIEHPEHVYPTIHMDVELTIRESTAVARK